MNFSVKETEEQTLFSEHKNRPYSQHSEDRDGLSLKVALIRKDNYSNTLTIS